MSYVCEQTDGQVFEDSRVQRFYQDAVIFITGGSGFLGSLLIEKLLRSCPGVSKIYLLLRDKKEKTAEKRLSELFNDVMFDRLRRCNPKAFDKVEIILGNCTEPSLGLDVADMQKLIEEVNVIYHVAATVKFDEKLSIAVNVNIRGTRDILEIAKQMKQLQSFIHVSTAFSFCLKEEIDEQVYDVHMNADKLIKMADILTENEMEILKEEVLGPFPNTYVMTKAVAENIVKETSAVLPIAIVRPSIVIATYAEPIAGWVNNFYGTSGVVMGVGIGLLRTLHCDPDAIADMVPADYVINAIIVTACHAARKKKTETLTTIYHSGVAFDELEKKNEIEVYNYVGSEDWPISWRIFMKATMEYALRVPSPHCVWYYCFTLNPNKYINTLYMWLLHYVPACIVDTAARLTGRKPRLLKAYQKIHKFMSVAQYFTIRQWKFHNNNVKSLWASTNETDRKLFPFELSSLDWNTYLPYYINGMRVYLLKDPMDTLPEGKRKYRKLKIAHYAILTVLSVLLFRFIYSVLSFLFSVVLGEIK